jgi:hypothetical protein
MNVGSNTRCSVHRLLSPLLYFCDSTKYHQFYNMNLHDLIYIQNRKQTLIYQRSCAHSFNAKHSVCSRLYFCEKFFLFVSTHTICCTRNRQASTLPFCTSASNDTLDSMRSGSSTGAHCKKPPHSNRTPLLSATTVARCKPFYD